MPKSYSNSIDSKDSCSDTSESQDQSSESTVFQFIDLSSNDPDTQKQNRWRARSHVIKIARRRMQVEKKREFVLLQHTERSAMRKFSQGLPYSINQNLLESSSTPWSHIVEDIIPTVRSTVKWSSLADLMVHHGTFNKYPTTKSDRV